MSHRPLVLVAVDHATNVERTVRAAVRTAESRGADVHIIRVAPPRSMRLDDRSLWSFEPLIAAEAGAAAAGLGSAARSADAAGVRVHKVTLRGAPERVLPAYAHLNAAIALVVERDYGSSRFWRNSGIVDELARRSPVPLLVLPTRSIDHEDQHEVRRIVAPVDFSIASAVALRTAADLARRHGARLTLVHALVEGSGAMVFSGSEAWDTSRRLPAHEHAVAARLRQRASVFGAHHAEAAVLTGAAGRAILETAARSHADLVVMGIPDRSWLDRMAFGSTLRSVLRGAVQPVLAVPVSAGSYPWPVIEDNRGRPVAAAPDGIAA